MQNYLDRYLSPHLNEVVGIYFAFLFDFHRYFLTFVNRIHTTKKNIQLKITHSL